MVSGKIYGSKEQLSPLQCTHLSFWKSFQALRFSSNDTWELEGSFPQLPQNNVATQIHDNTVGNISGEFPFATYTLSFSTPQPFHGHFYCPNFANEETEVLRDLVTCPRTYRW